MSEGPTPPPSRPPNDRRPARGAPSREHQRPRPHFDRTRTVQELKRLLDLILGEMKLEIGYELDGAASAPVEGEKTPADGEPDVIVRFRGPDEELLLSRNGELLLAIEYVAHRCLRLDPRLHDRVRFDCGDFRRTQLEELKLSARVAAQRVRETGQPFRFNPMSPRDRRIVHLELNGAPGVRTRSEGIGDRRQLVIYPANKKTGP
jgi:spoIIIJ-associated protein